MASYRVEVLNDSRKATADLSAKQFFGMKLSSTGVTFGTDPLADVLFGLLQNKPTSGLEASVGAIGVYPAKLGGTVSQGDYVTIDSAGEIVRARPGDWMLGYALEDGVDGDEKPILLAPVGRPFDMYFTANDDLSSKQYYAVAAHSTAGEVDLPDAGQEIIGIVQNAPAAAAAARIRTFGVSKFVAGTSGVTCGDPLEAENTGKLITKGNGSAGAYLCAVALTTTSADATGTCFIKGFANTES